MHIKRAVAVILAAAMLTNCTVYRPVVKEPESLVMEKDLMLHKDGLQLKLVGSSVRDDTLFARISHDQSVPEKKNSMTVVLKPGQEQAQDRSGRVAIPLSQISHIEYFEKDQERSKKLTIAAVSLGVLGVGILFLGLAIHGFNEFEDRMEEVFGD